MTFIDLFVLEKEVNSTQRPEGEGLRFPCELNSPCDIMEPVFIFEADENYKFSVEINYSDIKTGEEKLDFPFNVSPKFEQIFLW